MARDFAPKTLELSIRFTYPKQSSTDTEIKKKKITGIKLENIQNAYNYVF